MIPSDYEALALGTVALVIFLLLCAHAARSGRLRQ